MVTYSLYKERAMRGDTVADWQIWIDTGGTFTDCLAAGPDGAVRRVKVLSSSALRGVVVQQLAPDRLCVRAEWLAQASVAKGCAFVCLDREGGPSRRVIGAEGTAGILQLDRWSVHREALLNCALRSRRPC